MRARSAVWLRQLVPLALAALGVTLHGRAFAADLDLMSLLPQSGAVAGWRTQGKPAAYTRATLFDYINGGADFYLAYDFRQAAVAAYSAPGGPKITVELYDMGSSYDAFGVFAHESARESLPVGQESSYAGGLLTFWKDRLFARVFADRESAATREAIAKLGKAVSTSLTTMGDKPPLLRLLPRKGLAAGSVRYLHTDTTLNSVLYLPGNPLGLNRGTQVVYGEYPRAQGSPLKLVVVRYPDARRARSAFAQAAKQHGASGSTASTHLYLRETARHRWVGGATLASYVVLAANAPDAAAARRLLDAALAKAKASLARSSQEG